MGNEPSSRKAWLQNHIDINLFIIYEVFLRNIIVYPGCGTDCGTDCGRLLEIAILERLCAVGITKNQPGIWGHLNSETFGFGADCSHGIL